MAKRGPWATPAADEVLPVRLRGNELIRDPLLNKGTAFTPEERRALGLEGLLPSRVNSLDQQASRIEQQIARYDEPLNRYIALA